VIPLKWSELSSPDFLVHTFGVRFCEISGYRKDNKKSALAAHAENRSSAKMEWKSQYIGVEGRPGRVWDVQTILENVVESRARSTDANVRYLRCATPFVQTVAKNSYHPVVTRIWLTFNSGLQYVPFPWTFCFYPPPTLANILPCCGPVLGGTRLVLNGRGFVATGAITVKFSLHKSCSSNNFEDYSFQVQFWLLPAKCIPYLLKFCRLFRGRLFPHLKSIAHHQIFGTFLPQLSLL
jgi:hypothetical protein